VSLVSRARADGRHLWAFSLGCIAVTAGVLLHLPMFWMGRHTGFRLADMPMDPGMLWGMVFIVAGIAAAAYGLLPSRRPAPSDARFTVVAADDMPLTRAHWQLIAMLTVALIIDVMKPASLGFVVPGMIVEYGVDKTTVAWLPFAALAGTVVGSVAWGLIADVYGRRAAILLAAVMFIGTAICGAMPSLWWNVGMCFLMGAAAGGLLPVAYALLAEMMPSRHRGWALVLVGGLGAAGGYLAASGCSAWLQPWFGWRILWLLNLPTGLVLILLNTLIPESASFLLSRGHNEDAQVVMHHFGITVRPAAAVPPPVATADRGAGAAVDRASAAAAVQSRWNGASQVAAKTWALSVTAIAWGLINFGLLLWMPAHLVAKGYSVALSSELLAASALIAVPTVFLAALLYSRWSAKGALLGAIALTAAGLAGVLQLELGQPAHASPVIPIAILIVGINGIIAMLLPFAAESYPLKFRGRATGWVAACTKGGGLLAQLLSLSGLVPALWLSALIILAPVSISLVLVLFFCAETRGRDLHELEPA
jgi:putative MFS transporter